MKKSHLMGIAGVYFLLLGVFTPVNASQVWIADANGSIGIYDSLGNPDSAFSVPVYGGVADLTTVGNKVWIADANGSIGIYDSLGNPDSAFTVPVYGGVAGMTTVVPIPAALWLFGSGLLGLLGVARRK